MKYSVVIAALLALAVVIPAHADNPDVDSALKSRPELSLFTQALANTGVAHELTAGAPYTVFAPTNEAMARLSKEKYPCFYMTECQNEVTRILRNHIVSGTVYINEASAQRGGLYPMSNRFVPIGELGVHNYAVDGHDVVSSFRIGDATVYEIDGVIANPYELMSVEYADAYTPQQQVTTQSKTIPDPACGGSGCPDWSKRTTTYTRTTIRPN